MYAHSQLNTMRKAARCLLVTLTGLLLASCVTSRVEYSFDDSIETNKEDGVVLLTRRDNAESETEVNFIECVKGKLGRGEDGIELMDEQIFLDSLFPWFEPRVAPLTADALPALLGKPGVARKVAEAGVRYVMWLGGSVEVSDGGGSVSCDINVGCFGFTWWENGATYEAAIWDLKNRVSTGVISADVKGRSYLPAIIIPIPLIAPTRSTACDELADQLKKQFVGSS